MIDTHAHLTEKILYDNLDQVLANALNNGVTKIICVGMDEKANNLAIKLTQKYFNVYASVGIHPNAVENNPLNLEKLTVQAKEKKVVAIGEIGIDLYRSKENLAKQSKYFLAQIDLASRLNLPVVIHSRNSADVIYQLLKSYKNIQGVMHCYSEHLDLVDKFVDLGLYIGVGGIVTFKNALEVVEIAKRIPLSRLLIETDSPYLAPAPYRGKPNEPAYVKYVLLKLAEIKGISAVELEKITTENAQRLFAKMDE